MTLKAASDSSSSMDRPNTKPDFLGSRQCIRSFTAERWKELVRTILVCPELAYNEFTPT